MHTKYLVIGAGMSGLAFANFIDSDDYLILEREPEIGGWCKTIKRQGFVWDFSGHFFHFKHPEIERYLRDRMPEDEVTTVAKNSKILFKDAWVDFPFQKNIHQLAKEDFIECLYDLFFREEADEAFASDSFQGMLYEKFGRGISEKFLVPYNEKLYACDLEELDRDAMGRFFPYADLEDIIRNMRQPDNASYNATFTYPKNGAIMYVNALASEVDDERMLLDEALVDIDLGDKVATTSSGKEIEFEYIVSSAPFDRLLKIADLEHDPEVFTYNKVLCFNLGFDKKGPEGVHWIYFPEKKYSFYRVGFYDNILGDERMSLYVEIGYPWPTTTWSSIRPTYISPASHARPSTTTARCSSCAGSTPSAATAAGPTAPSKTISSRRARWPKSSTSSRDESRPIHEDCTQTQASLCCAHTSDSRIIWRRIDPPRLMPEYALRPAALPCCALLPKP